MELMGAYISLRPLTVKERPLFFRWATQSAATPFWYGELYGDEVPDYPDFKHDWQKHYFDGSAPRKGRCFAILLMGKPIGEINYNEFHSLDRSVELDIIIADEINMGKGYGSDAIHTLVQYLFTEMDIDICRIEVVTRNPRAIRAYEKAGFIKTLTYPANGVEYQVMELRKPA